jgi:hypothetical protein
MTGPTATHATTSKPHRPDRSPHGTPISRATGGLPRSYRAGGGVAVPAVSQDGDDLIGQRDTARAYTASTHGNGTTGSDAAPQPGPADGQRGPGVPADAPAPAASPANRSRP